LLSALSGGDNGIMRLAMVCVIDIGKIDDIKRSSISHGNGRKYSVQADYGVWWRSS
jgi:hypothetical protein